MIDEKKEIDKIKIISRIEKIKLPEKICQKSCRICSSPYICEIHQMRNNGAEFAAIIDYLVKEYNYKISPSTLSNHFANYKEIIARTSAEVLEPQTKEEVAEVARHTQAVIRLIDKCIQMMEERMKNNFYIANVSDLEKLFMIRHRILSGEMGGEKDIMEIWIRAQRNYGVSERQGILNFPTSR